MVFQYLGEVKVFGYTKFLSFTKGDNFCDFLFASLNDRTLTTLQKWSTVTVKNLLLELTSI